MTREATMALAKLLQLPANCFEATLHLSAVKGPILTTRCHINNIDVPAEQVFELRDITPKPEPAPLDLDKLTAEATWRVNDFIDERAHMHKILTTYEFEWAAQAMKRRWAAQDLARKLVRELTECLEVHEIFKLQPGGAA